MPCQCARRLSRHWARRRIRAIALSRCPPTWPPPPLRVCRPRRWDGPSRRIRSSSPLPSPRARPWHGRCSWRADRGGGEPAPMAVAVKPLPTPAPAPPGADARFQSLVLDFLAYLELERGLSRNTLGAYRTDLLQFGRFLDARGVGVTDASHGDLAA